MAGGKQRPRRLQLSQDLDGSQVKPLLDQLAKKRGNPLQINASKVERLGAPCAQVLVAAARTWRDEMHVLQIVKPSESFIEGIDQMGLTLTDISFEDAEK